MRIVLFGAQLFNNANYALASFGSGHEVFLVPTIPIKRKEFYKSKETFLSSNRRLFEELQQKHIRVVPIFLNIVASSSLSSLKPLDIVRDFLNIYRTLASISPAAVINFYVLHSVPLVFLKSVLRYHLFLVATGGDVNLHNGKFHIGLRRFLFRQSNLVFAVSAEIVGKILGESGISAKLMRTGADPSFYKKLKPLKSLRRKWGVEKKALIVSSIGNFSRMKGVHILIQAVSILKKTKPDLEMRLFIVGKGPDESFLRTLVSQYNLEKVVVFLGYIDRHELREMFNISDMFVMSSFSEGLPFSLLEAMASETVCIATPVGDIPIVLKEGYNGFFTKIGDPRYLERKIEQVMSLPENLKSQIGRNARETIESRFDMRKTTHEMMQIVCQDIERNN